MIIDCHTHWHSDWSGSDSTDPSRWLAVFDRGGIERAVVLPTDGLMDDTLLQRDNDQIAKTCERSGGRMIPFCTVNIWQGKRALEELDRCIHVLKFRGIKFHPWLQASPVNHPVMDEVCERAQAADIPILFHDGTPPFSLPSQIGLLAKRHPGTKMILGHCGLLEFWEEAIMVLQRCENVWGCLCSPHPGAMKELVRRAPLERLCWGSDFGFGTFDLVAYRFGLFRTLRLSDAVENRILRENPASLFRAQV